MERLTFWLDRILLFFGLSVTAAFSSIFIGTFVHEQGHRIMGGLLGYEISVSGWNYVGFTQPPGISVMLAGPLTAVLFGCFLMGAARKCLHSALGQHLMVSGVVICFWDGLVNLLPIYPKTDGYKILQALGLI